MPTSFVGAFRETSKFNTSTLLEENLYQRRLEDPYLDSFEFEKRYVEAVRRNQPEKFLAIP